MLAAATIAGMDARATQPATTPTASAGIAPNEVYVTDDGIIEIHVVGDQTAASVRAMAEVARALAGDCRAAGRPVLIIDNLLCIGQVPQEARQVVVEYGKLIDYDRLAMVGDNPLLRLGSNLLIRAVGKGARLRYFDDARAAQRWLLARR